MIEVEKVGTHIYITMGNTHLLVLPEEAFNDLYKAIVDYKRSITQKNVMKFYYESLDK